MDETEITLVTGERHAVQGALNEVEANVLAASRGALMQFAWLTDAASGEKVGINPACIVSIRAVPSALGSSLGPVA